MTFAIVLDRGLEPRRWFVGMRRGPDGTPSASWAEREAQARRFGGWVPADRARREAGIRNTPGVQIVEMPQDGRA